MDDDARSTFPTAGSGDRRRTISGARPDIDHDDGNTLNFDTAAGEIMRFPWSSPPAPLPPRLPLPPGAEGAPVSPGNWTTNKKGLPGNVLARFGLVRNVEDTRPVFHGERNAEAESFKPRKSTDDDGESASPVLPAKSEHALAAALRPIKTRRRKGSLRKTALLGGKRLVNEGRERKNSLLQRSPTSKPSAAQSLQQPSAAPTSPMPLGLGEDRDVPRLHRRHGPDALHSASASDSGWSEPAAISATKLSLLTGREAQQNLLGGTNDLGSPLDLKSPTSQTSYTSTTDDDDVLTFDRPANTFLAQQREGVQLKALTSTATGYFPTASSVSGIARRRSSKQSRSSPLSHSMTALTSFPEPEPHDYTETEYWGWVILFVTWLTFAVGMGSCLEIWSWAWDVGETPYAPPELEDDPTLPIVGYYPALIVLTGVVAWVWVTVAWVGMKYFRHAKIEV